MGLDDEMSMFCDLVKDITSSSHGKPGNTQVNYCKIQCYFSRLIGQFVIFKTAQIQKNITFI